MKQGLPAESTSVEEHKWLPVKKNQRWRLVRKQQLIAATLIFSDVLLALLVWKVASLLQSVFGTGGLSVVAAATIKPSVAVWVGLRALLGLYPGYGLDPVELLRRNTYSVFATLTVLAIVAVGFQVGDSLSRLLLALAFSGLLFLAPFVRHLVTWCLKEIGAWGKPVVILSYRDMGVQFLKLLKQEWILGYNPLALFDYRLMSDEKLRRGAAYEKTLADAVGFARKRGVDTVIFVMPLTRRERVDSMVSMASTSFRNVILVVPNLIGVTNSAVTGRNLAGRFAVRIKYNLLEPWALRLKRAMDLVVSVIGGGIVLPLFLVIALLIRLESRGPVFYRDIRMGKNGELFPCLKFRTMVEEAEDLLQRMLEENTELRAEYSKYHKLRYDPRVTRVGRLLRKTSLDELPQLWNVLQGEMSLVGPRPYLAREAKEIGVARREILRVPPGITGPWQVAGRNLASFGERVEMDVYYVRDWSVWLDILLLARTMKTVLLGRGAY